MQLASMIDIEPRVYTSPSGQSRAYALFGSPQIVQPGPQAHYVESLLPEQSSRVHFHEVNQFQVFLEGDGRFGNTPIEPVMVQYSDAYTPYGPIVGGEIGYRFLTLRVAASVGTFYMPERRAERRRTGGRQIRAQFVVDDLEVGAPWSQVVGPFDDHLAAFAARAAPGELLSALPPEVGAGQYYVVARGSLRHGGRDHPLASSIFVDPSDEPPELRASSAGLSLVAVVFPQPGPD